MDGNLSLKKVLGAIISSIDHYNYLLKGHHRRTAILTYQLANSYGLSSDKTAKAVLAASLHDIGALYIKERDQLLKADVEYPEHHEILGAIMLEGFEPFAQLKQIIRHHHIKYEDIMEKRISTEDVPIECYFVHLADRIDVLSETIAEEDAECKIEKIKEMINERFGTTFPPFLQETFNNCVDNDNFWEKRSQEEFYDLLMLSLDESIFSVEKYDVAALAQIFSRIVDFKSKWTSRHSLTVATLAHRIGQLAGLDDKNCYDLKIAGLLHDIGKVGIPIEILDKPAKLTVNEFFTMQKHSMYTKLILSNIDGFEKITKWASMHHEKHDQSGYPMGIGSGQFSIEVDILAFSDIFAALTENRPYRHGLDKEDLLKILKEFTPEKLSEDVFSIITEHIDELMELEQQTQSSVAVIADQFDNEGAPITSMLDG